MTATLVTFFVSYLDARPDLEPWQEARIASEFTIEPEIPNLDLDLDQY